MSTSTSSASPPVSTSSVGPTTLGDKRPVLGDYLGNLFGAVDESLAIQTLFEVGTSDIELYAKYDRDQPEMAKGAETFLLDTCALRSGEHKASCPLAVDDCLVAPTRSPTRGDPKGLAFYATVTLAVARVTSVARRSIFVEVLGWLSADPTTPMTKEEVGPLYRTKAVMLRRTKTTYLVLDKALSGGIIKGLCTLGPRNDAKRFRPDLSGNTYDSSLDQGLLARTTAEASGGGVKDVAFPKDSRLDCDGRRWICTAKEWAPRLVRLRFPLRLMSTELATRLFPDLVLDLDVLFHTAENLSYSQSGGYLDLFKQTPRVRGFAVVTCRTLFSRFFEGDWYGRSIDHFSLIHCHPHPSVAWSQFQRHHCSLEARVFLAQLVKHFELVLTAFLDKNFLTVTAPLQSQLEDVEGVFCKTGDEVTYFRVHEAFSHWAMDIRRETHGSPHFPDHTSLVGEGARALLGLHLRRLIDTQRAANVLSPYPHDLDYTQSGQWATMKTPPACPPTSSLSLSTPTTVPSTAPIAPPRRASSSIICGYHLAHLLGVQSAKGQLITCRRPTGCLLGPHDCTLRSITKAQARQALEVSPLKGSLLKSTEDAITTSKAFA